MHQEDTLKRIAKILGKDIIDAQRFCAEVQKSVRPPIPPPPLILYYLSQRSREAHDPTKLARIIEAARLGEPYEVFRDRKSSAKGKGTYEGPEVHLAFSPVEELRKCPHGVPRTQKCRLCDRADLDWDSQDES